MAYTMYHISPMIHTGAKHNFLSLNLKNTEIQVSNLATFCPKYRQSNLANFYENQILGQKTEF